MTETAESITVHICVTCHYDLKIMFFSVTYDKYRHGVAEFASLAEAIRIHLSAICFYH